MVPPKEIIDTMPDPGRKWRTRSDELTQDVEDTKPPDKIPDMPKEYQVNGTAELSPRSQTSKTLQNMIY